MAKTKKSEDTPVELKITVLQDKFKLRHLRLLVGAESDFDNTNFVELLDGLQELTEEDIFDYPTSAFPDIITAIIGQMNIGGDSEDSKN